MITTIAPNSTIYLPTVGVIISGALAIFNIHIIPMVMIPVPKAIILLIHSHKSSSPNNAISINAVGLAISAQANITHEMIIYLSESR